jgi:hypothetical protein
LTTMGGWILRRALGFIVVCMRSMPTSAISLENFVSFFSHLRGLGLCNHLQAC